MDGGDFSGGNPPNPTHEPLDFQGETPNPAEIVVFDEKGKTDFPKGEERIGQLGENHNRDNPQGEPNREGERTGITYNHHQVPVVVGENEIQLIHSHIQYRFKGASLTEEQIKRFLKTCAEQGKDLGDVVENTYFYFAIKKKPIQDLMGSLMHGAQQGWEVSESVEEREIKI